VTWLTPWVDQSTRSHPVPQAVVHFRRRRRGERANAGAFIHNCQDANGSRIGLVRIRRFVAGRDLDKEAVGFRAEAMGQGQDKVGQGGRVARSNPGKNISTAEGAGPSSTPAWRAETVLLKMAGRLQPIKFGSPPLFSFAQEDWLTCLSIVKRVSNFERRRWRERVRMESC
jgi:hypothetical protein